MGMYRWPLAQAGIPRFLGYGCPNFPDSSVAGDIFFEKNYKICKISLCKREKMGYNDKE